MITENTVSALAKKYQTSQLNIYREYVQHLFLSYLYRQPESGRLCFKGGTALRILYGSPRFSEDLDFSAGFRSRKPMDELLISVLSEIEREGIQTRMDEVKTTSGGYLAIIGLSVNNRKLEIQLETSLREKAVRGEMDAIVNDFVPTYTLMHLTQKTLTEEKIQALFSRKKPRDFYDLYFMLRANILSASQRSMLSGIPALLKKTDISFSKELKAFLPKSHWPIIKDFKKSITREIERYFVR